MRRLALTIVPLLFLACGREPTAPVLPTLSVGRRAEIVRDVSDIVVGYNLGSCGDFDILADWNALLQFTFYYEGDGNLVQQHVRYRVVGAEPLLQLGRSTGGGGRRPRGNPEQPL